MTRSFQSLRLAALSALLCGAVLHPAFAQSTINGSTPEPVLQEADANDRDFVKMLGQTVANEGAVASLAVRTTKNAEVRAVANAIRSDRKRALSGLADASAGAGFTPPDTADSSERVLETDLRAKAPADFDRAYLERAVQLDQSALDVLDREITDGYNSRIVAYAKYRKSVIAAELGTAEDALRKIRK